MHDACLGSTGKPACLSRKRRIHDACPAETGDPNRPTDFQKRPCTTTADRTRNPDTKGPPKRAVASAGYAAVPWQHFSRRHRAVPMRMALGGIGQRPEARATCCPTVAPEYIESGSDRIHALLRIRNAQKKLPHALANICGSFGYVVMRGLNDIAPCQDNVF